MLKWLKKRLECELHGIEFQDGTAPVRYGRIALSDEYHEARKKLFPHANSFVVGGCYMPDEIPPERPVKYCPLCRESQKKFEKQSVNSQ